MARRTKEEAQATRGTIMNMALELFCRQGIARTSLVDIAKAAGVTRGAIYWHFKDKDELFSALWQEVCVPLSHLVAASMDSEEPDPLGKLQLFLVEVLHSVVHSQVHQQMFTILFNLGNEGAEVQKLAAQMSQLHDEFLSDLHQALQNAVRRGQLPSDINVHRAVTLLHCSLDGLILKWLRFPHSFDLAHEAEPLIASLIFTLRQGLTQQ
ncbi:MAG: TetR family transcriptional regulator [Aeromonadaceae bacterium]